MDVEFFNRSRRPLTMTLAARILAGRVANPNRIRDIQMRLLGLHWTRQPRGIAVEMPVVLGQVTRLVEPGECES